MSSLHTAAHGSTHTSTHTFADQARFASPDSDAQCALSPRAAGLHGEAAGHRRALVPCACAAGQARIARWRGLPEEAAGVRLRGGRVKQLADQAAALALLRCVMSSPVVAEATLRARIARLAAGEEPADDQRFADYVLDLSDQEMPQDFEPIPVVEAAEAQLGSGERQRLQSFVRRAARLRGESDPKLLAAVEEIAGLLRDGFSPIVYCRFIATADYLAAELGRRLQKAAHRRVRQTIHAGRVTVRPQLPLDVLGVYVLVPVPKGIVGQAEP